MLRKFSLFLIMLLQVALVSAEIYDLSFTKQEKEAKAYSEQGSLIKLRFKETPESLTPIFLYDIEKTKNPHKIPKKTFEESVFLLENGNNYFSQKNYEKAIEFYKKALEVNPSFVSAYHNIGVASFLLGKYSQSIESFKKVEELTPLNAYPYFYLGWIYKRLENYRKAIHYLKIAKKIFESQANTFWVKKTEDILNSLKIP